MSFLTTGSGRACGLILWLCGLSANGALAESPPCSPPCPPPVECRCGNGTCDLGENPCTCPSDCLIGACPVCGDGSCDTFENACNCPVDCLGKGLIKADGCLDDEVAAVLDFNGNMVRDALEGRRGAACFQVDNIIDGGFSLESNVDGFRDAGLRCPNIPSPGGLGTCDAESQCADLGFSTPSVRSSVNTGKLTIIYWPDTDGVVSVIIEPHTGGNGIANTSAQGDDIQVVPVGQMVSPGATIISPGPNAVLDTEPTGDDIYGDDSLLYVGLDIFNGDRRTIQGAGTDSHDIDFVKSDPAGTVCENGVADFNGDGTPDFFGVPFDVDADGDPNCVGRWDIPCSLNENCAPGTGCPGVASPPSDLSRETYRLFLFACTNPTAGIDNGCGDGFPRDTATCISEVAIEAAANGDIRLNTSSTDFKLCPQAMAIPPQWVSTFPIDGMKTCQLIRNDPPLDNGDRRDVEFVIRHIDSVVDVRFPGTPFGENDRYRIARGGVETMSDSNGDSAAEDRIQASWFVPLPEIEVKKHVRCCPDGECAPPVFDPMGVCVANCYLEEEEGMPGNGELPGSRFEFRIEVENTGNVPLTATLQDVLDGPIEPVPGTLSVCLFREGAGPECTPNASACPGTELGFSSAPGCLITVANAPNQLPPLNPGFLRANDGFLDRLNGENNCLGILEPVEVCGPTPRLGDRVVIKFQAQVPAFATDFCTDISTVDIRNSITAIGDPDLPTEPGPMGDLNCPAFNGNEVYDRAAMIDTLRERGMSPMPKDDNVVTIDIKCRDIDLNKEVRRRPTGSFAKKASVNGEPNAAVEIEYRYRIRNDGELPESITFVDHYLCCDVVNTTGASFVMNACALCTQPAITPMACASSMPPAGTMFFTMLPHTVQDITCAIRFNNQAAVAAFLALDNNRTGDCGDDMISENPPAECYRNYASVTAYADDYIREKRSGGNLLADTVKLAGSDDPQLHPAPNVPAGPGQPIVGAGPDRILQTTPAFDDERTRFCPPLRALHDYSCADICPCTLPVDKSVRCIKAGNPQSSSVCDTTMNCGGPYGVGADTDILPVVANSNVQFAVKIDRATTVSEGDEPFCQLCFDDDIVSAPTEIQLIPNTARLCRCGSTQMCCPINGFNLNGPPVCVNEGTGNCAFAFPFEDDECLELTFNARIAANANPAPPDPCNFVMVTATEGESGVPCSGDVDCTGDDSVCVDIRPHPAIEVTKRVQCIAGCELSSTTGLLNALDVVPNETNGVQVRYQIDVANTGQVPIKQVCITDAMTPICRDWLCGGSVCESLVAFIQGRPESLFDTFCLTSDPFNVSNTRQCFTLPFGTSLLPGEILTIYFDLNIPHFAASRTVCRNDVLVEGYRADEVCPPEVHAMDDSFATATVKRPLFACNKEARAFNDCGLSTPFTTNLTLPCDVDYSLTIEYRLTFTNEPNSQTPAYNIMLCDQQLVADAVAACLTVQNCALCSGACDGVNDTCANFPGPLNPGQSVTALCQIVVPCHTEWENFAGSDPELEPPGGGVNALNDYHNSAFGRATGRLEPNQCGMRTETTMPCTSRVRIAEACELSVVKRARCIIEDTNPSTDDCVNPLSFGPYQNDLLQVAPGSLVQFETIVENVGEKAGICLLKFTDLLTQQPGDILPCGSVQILVRVGNNFVPLPPSPPLPACFGLPNFTRANSGDLGCDPAAGCSQVSECDPATELGCCELNPANYPSLFPGGQFQPGQQIALRYNARIPSTPSPVHCPSASEPNHQCVNPTDCPAVNPPIDCPPDPVNTMKVEGRCCPPSPTSEYQCCAEDPVALNILDLDICCEKAYTQIKWDSDADCTGASCGTCMLEPTDRTDPLPKPATGAPIDLTGFIFPAEITIQIEGHNYSEAPVNLQAVDLSLSNHAASTPGVSILPGCQFGQTRMNVPPGGVEIWTCTLRIDTHEAGRMLAMLDDTNHPICPGQLCTGNPPVCPDGSGCACIGNPPRCNQCTGDSTPNVYRNWAKVVATPATSSSGCPFVKEEFCWKSVKFPPPCRHNIEKTVRCLRCLTGCAPDGVTVGNTGCAPDWVTVGNSLECLTTLPDESARFEIRLDYPLLNTMGTPTPVDDMPNPKLPVVCIEDRFACGSEDWVCPSSVQATLIAAGGSPVNVSTDFAGLTFTGARQCYRFNSPGLAMRPWLAPGESLVITFDVKVPDTFTLPGPSESCPNPPCPGADCSCPSGTPTCCNTVKVEGYTEGCPLMPPPLPPDHSCRDCDCASLKVKDAVPVCRKCLYVDLGANGSVDESCCSDGSDTVCVISNNQGSLRLRYEFTARNTGNTELANVCLCDDDDMVGRLLSAGATMVGTCGLNRNSTCTGAGNDCASIACLAPGQSHTVACEFELTENQFNALFGDNTVCISNQATLRGTPIIGDPPGTCNNLNTANTCDIGMPKSSSACRVDLCQEVCEECPCTKVQIDIWNENEVRFSGTERCICVWDQTLLSEYTASGVANHFLIGTLQTPKGKARINGVRSTVCPYETINAPLIGIAAKRIHFASGAIEWAGSSLVGAGEEPGCIEYTPVGGAPDESVWPGEDTPHQPPAIEADLLVPAGLAETTPNPFYTDDGVETFGGLIAEHRAGISKKGSLLVWPKVELKWNSAGQLIQDTYLQITNDYAGEVKVLFYFAHGDEATPPVFVGSPPQLLEAANPGCIWVDVEITLTPDESAYWSAATGLPKGVSPFSTLDPGTPPGRPDTDPLNPGGRVLRGYVVGWAIDNNTKHEIRWNHLLGHGMLVNYQNSSAWDYRAWSFQVVPDALGFNIVNGIPVLGPANNGDRLATPGRLRLNGSEYENPPNQLVFDFFAVNAPLFSGPISSLIGDTDLTIWIAVQSYTGQ